MNVYVPRGEGKSPNCGSEEHKKECRAQSKAEYQKWNKRKLRREVHKGEDFSIILVNYKNQTFLQDKLIRK